MIQVTPSIAIDESELHEDFMRASGAGGQNIQKVETAVQLRFDVANSPNLPAPVRSRLGTLAGRRMTKAGVLIISAQRHRTQERNRADALERLLALNPRSGRAAAAAPPQDEADAGLEAAPSRRQKAALRRQIAARRAGPVIGIIGGQIGLASRLRMGSTSIGGLLARTLLASRFPHRAEQEARGDRQEHGRARLTTRRPRDRCASRKWSDCDRRAISMTGWAELAGRA